MWSALALPVPQLSSSFSLGGGSEGLEESLPGYNLGEAQVSDPLTSPGADLRRSCKPAVVFYVCPGKVVLCASGVPRDARTPCGWVSWGLGRGWCQSRRSPTWSFSPHGAHVTALVSAFCRPRGGGHSCEAACSLTRLALGLSLRQADRRARCAY